MKIKRYYQDVENYLRKDKVLVVYGPRQVGKTTLLLDFLKTTKLKYKLDTGDNIKTQEILGSSDIDLIKEYAEGYELIAIDEAQKIPNIGKGLKILVDYIPGLMVIATGSSSFELSGQIGEPLVGRKTKIILFPISQIELFYTHNSYEMRKNLEDWLIFGGYPEVITAEAKHEKMRLLEEITQSYLFKDILELDRVKNTKLLVDLLRLVAFQIGSEVSYNELSQNLGVDSKTVARYLDIFEKSFIIYNLRGFSRNLRKEINKKSKYYFYDNGVRNAVISNFNSIELRDDIGSLWENFLFMERMKKRAFNNIYANIYFWRTWDKKEIDLIEEREGQLFGYEFKWKNRKVKTPKEWLDTYKNSEYKVISGENYLHFIT